MNHKAHYAQRLRVNRKSTERMRQLDGAYRAAMDRDHAHEVMLKISLVNPTGIGGSPRARRAAMTAPEGQ